MASKSTSQRVIEVIALLAVAGCLVPVGIAVWGHFYKPEPPKHPALEAAPPPPGPPQRESVKSVDKLPKTYPAIADVTLRGPARASASPAGQRTSTTVRHLNAYAGNGVHLSPDAKLAVVFEATPANTARVALWDLDTGKLIRFFSGEVGAATRDYRGVENAEFGAKIDLDGLQWGSFSPDGKKFAAHQLTFKNQRARHFYLWDVPSGKLLWQVTEPDEHVTVLFPSPEFLAIGSSATMREYAWRRVDAATGESELLMPPASNAGPTSEGAAFAGKIAFLSRQMLTTIDVDSRQRLTGTMAKEDEPDKSPSHRRFLWYSLDGKQVYGFGGSEGAWIEAWDAATHQLVRSTKVVSQGSPQADVYPAPAANLVGNRGQFGGVDFYDVATGAQKFSLQIPLPGTPLKAVSSDARRMLLQTEQTSLLVVDFTAELPEGKVDLAALLGPGPLAATR